ncbi:hypothetical protein [Aquabacterium sp. CECT 9606]|uniref:hypothetical protein n=1 Tax=Aquabacterium sp. CECT 9606 TaxID=2845822 RepID=UPI001E5A2923|nr:hypothetical protein [Aquabacterium sp. CECT 9606]CAH0354208.1 hypothetical protein AQB9606_03596 [Aquabacterium sp. CECT 9606]
MKPYLVKSAIAMAVTLQMFATAASAQQLLNNTGFEIGSSGVSCSSGTLTVSGQIGAYWADNSCWIASTSTLTYALEGANAATGFAPHSGALSQSVDSSAGVGQFYINVPLDGGKKYTSSIWLKADRALDVVLQLRLNGGPYTAYGSRVAKVTTTWQQFTFDGYSPASSTQLNGGLYVVLQNTGKVWLDDASVTAVADANIDTVRSDVVVPKSYFGLHVHRDPNWPTVGSTIGSERLWDADGTQWADIFPTDPALGGTPNWTKFDARVQRALDNGAEPVVVLGGNIPQWASSDPTGSQTGSSFYGPGSSAPPVSEAVWTAWVTAVAQHAQGKVKLWEIWNEPYQNGTFKADIPRLARLAQLAYPILKNASSTNKVLSPSFDVYDNNFLERFLQAGGGSYMDIVSVHAYDFFGGNLLDATVSAGSRTGDPAAPEAMYYKEHLIKNTKSILARYGFQSLPVWNTEGGYGGAKFANGTSNDAAGAPWVARNLILGWALGGLDRNFYYAWDQRDVGWVAGAREPASPPNSNNYIKTAAGTAYQQVATWLTGKKVVSKTVDANGTWTIVLNPGIFAAKQFIVWNPAGTFGYTVPSGIDYVSYVTNLAGVKTSIPAPFSVNQSPALLTRN